MRFISSNLKALLSFLLVFIAIFIFVLSYSKKVYIDRDIVFKNVPDNRFGESSLTLDIYYKRFHGSHQKPAVILLHGGGFGGGDKGYTPSQGNFYPELGKSFARAGFVAFSVNYRLWPNCPLDSFYIELGNAISDVYAAAQWIKENHLRYGVDTSLILIGGDSAGGALALNVSYQYPDLFIGCFDLWGGLPPYGLKDSTSLPVNTFLIDKNTPPTCIVHGTNDEVVPIETSLNLAKLLHNNGIYYEMHCLENENHYPVHLYEQIERIIIDFSKKVI